MKLNDQITKISGVGEKTAKKLSKLGIKTIHDLVYYFPRAWQDFSQPQPIKNIRLGEEIIIKAKVTNVSSFYTAKKHTLIIKADLEDETGAKIPAIWFGQRFLLYNLKPDSTWYFLGKATYDFNLKKTVLSSPIYVIEAKILPIYPETEGINSKYLRIIVKKALEQIEITEWLPAEIVKTEDFFDLAKALRQIHFPDDNNNLEKTKFRLAFDELFLLVMQILSRKKELAQKTAPKIAIKKELLQKFVKSLPYKLTNAQRKAGWEIICDLAGQPIAYRISHIAYQNNKPYAISNKLQSVPPMNRLLNGDVGSGKTVVAVMAALNCIKQGYKVAWMAPTEILATQHFQNVNKLLKNFDVDISLLTSNKIARISEQKNLKTKELKNDDKQEILNSDLIIGTHSLIQKDVKIENLGLVIIDEQHRFGVKQRASLSPNKLTEANEAKKLVPHFLSMTATPIPRSLALSIFGDLDFSILDEMPEGRQKIITKLVDTKKRDKAYKFIRKQIKQGRQAFVVCPLIEENSKSEIRNSKQIQNKKLQIQNLFDTDRKSVKVEFEKLSTEIFPDLKIAMLHGKMKPAEKEKIMSEFAKNKINIIVSTSVVEVGIDIPNATIMMIEDAQAFGLAQLHQFRGRVGRGEHKSYCLLFSANLTEDVQKRLLALEKLSDGFKLAELDLATRGSGDFAGVSQSGFLKLKLAKLTDIIGIKRARNWSQTILEKGLENYPKLKNMVKIKDNIHLE